MMVLNGAASLQNVWCQQVPVMPDMDYEFSFGVHLCPLLPGHSPGKCEWKYRWSDF